MASLNDHETSFKVIRELYKKKKQKQSEYYFPVMNVSWLSICSFLGL